MTKEAKIGMLTGLGVIVLIGVMLSNYLGAAPGAAPAAMATGRMAALPIGQAKRDEMLQEVGVPPMVQADSLASAGGLTSVPPAFAVDTHQDVPLAVPAVTGPVMRAAVAAVPAGPVAEVPAAGMESPATVQVVDAGALTPAAAPAGAGPAAAGSTVAGSTTAAKPAPVKVAGEEYVIVKGDGLGKIVAKFYKTNTAEGRQRIIAANPGIMKDGQVFLVAGRKLVIPAAVATPAAPVAMAKGPTQPITQKVDPKKVTDTPAVVIGLPGSGKTTDKTATPAKATDKTATPAKTPADAVAKADPKKADAKKADAKVYVVKDGDTLKKIAMRVDSANYLSVMNKIVAANGIKDANAIQPGESLKMPM